MDDNKAIILNSYSMKWYIPERLPRCLRMIGWHESQVLGCQELRQKVFLCLPSHTAHSQDTFKGTVSLFWPRGPEIALTFLINELIVKLQNSHMGASYGRNGENFRLLFKWHGYFIKWPGFLLKWPSYFLKRLGRHFWRVTLKMTPGYLSHRKKDHWYFLNWPNFFLKLPSFFLKLPGFFLKLPGYFLKWRITF